MDFSKIFGVVKADIGVMALHGPEIVARVDLYVTQIQSVAAAATGPQKLAAVVAALRADFAQSLPKVAAEFDAIQPVLIAMINGLVALYKTAAVLGFVPPAVAVPVAAGVAVVQAVEGATGASPFKPSPVQQA